MGTSCYLLFFIHLCMGKRLFDLKQCNIKKQETSISKVRISTKYHVQTLIETTNKTGDTATAPSYYFGPGGLFFTVSLILRSGNVPS